MHDKVDTSNVDTKVLAWPSIPGTNIILEFFHIVN